MTSDRGRSIVNPRVAKAWTILQKEGPLCLARQTARFLSARLSLSVVRLGTYTTYFMSRLRYDAPAHPYRTIEIQPADVNYWSERISYEDGLGRVEGGDWDVEKRLLSPEDHPIVNGIRQRFVEGCEWEETVYVEHAIEQLSRTDTESYYGCESVEEFLERRCGYLEAIYDAIERNGYRPTDSVENEEGPGTSLHDLEPIVSIGRDGTIIFCGSGKHRFAIARVLDIPIPVNVAVRHERWQSIRDDIATADSVADLDRTTSEFLDHPDIRDVLPEASRK